MGTISEDEAVILARFPRRNRETGATEELRVSTGDFQGRQVTSARIWFQTKDGWRPSKVGVTAREHELDQWIEALQEARRLVLAEGRSTEPTPASRGPQRAQQGGWRRPHQEGAARLTPRPQRPQPLLDRRPGVPAPPFDEFD